MLEEELILTEKLSAASIGLHWSLIITALQILDTNNQTKSHIFAVFYHLRVLINMKHCDARKKVDPYYI